MEKRRLLPAWIVPALLVSFATAGTASAQPGVAHAPDHHEGKGKGDDKAKGADARLGHTPDGRPLLGPNDKVLRGPDGKELRGPDGKELRGAEGKPLDPAAAADADDDQGAADDKPESKTKRRNYLRATKKALEEKLGATKRELSPAEKDAVKKHWRTSMRLWRIRNVADAAGDKATVTKVDALIAKADARTFAALKALPAANAATPNAATPNAATPNAATPNAAAPNAATPNAATPNAATPNAATPNAGAK